MTLIQIDIDILFYFFVIKYIFSTTFLICNYYLFSLFDSRELPEKEKEVKPTKVKGQSSMWCPHLPTVSIQSCMPRHI